jgi:hypothetical protein
MLRGWETMRLGSMVILLLVLGMVIFRPGKPQVPLGSLEDSPRPMAPERPDARSHAERGNEDRRTPLPPAPHPAPPVPRPASETAPDEDYEQSTQAAEEFQAVTDGTLGIQPAEMFAYARLLHWTAEQSFPALQRRASQVRLNDLVQFPDKYRGKPLRLRLNVRRVLDYDASDKRLGVPHLYEIWGWTEETQAWLYCVVTTELPQGMPIGASVEEQAQFAGYFFKLQGYYETGAKPRDKPLRAPLLVGRLLRYPSAADHARAGSRWSDILLVAGAAFVLGGVVLFQYLHQRRVKGRQVQRQQASSETVRQWLADGSGFRVQGSGFSDEDPDPTLNPEP